MASKRAQRRKACGRKNRYSQDEAEEVVRRMRKQGARSINAYHCAWCNGWHVGHMPHKVRQSMRSRAAHMEV